VLFTFIQPGLRPIFFSLLTILFCFGTDERRSSSGTGGHRPYIKIIYDSRHFYAAG